MVVYDFIITTYIVIVCQKRWDHASKTKTIWVLTKGIYEYSVCVFSILRWLCSITGSSYEFNFQVVRFTLGFWVRYFGFGQYDFVSTSTVSKSTKTPTEFNRWNQKILFRTVTHLFQTYLLFTIFAVCPSRITSYWAYWGDFVRFAVSI